MDNEQGEIKRERLNLTKNMQIKPDKKTKNTCNNQKVFVCDIYSGTTGSSMLSSFIWTTVQVD